MYRPFFQFKKSDGDPFWLVEKGLSSAHFPENISALAWSPDGTKLASVHADYAVRVWDIKEKQVFPIHQLVHGKFPIAVAWSPSGNHIATGDTRGDPVRIWDSYSGEQLQELYYHQSWPYSLDWSPDGKYLVSGGGDSVVALWNTSEWQVIRELQPTKEKFRDVFNTVRFNRDGSKLAFAGSDGDVYVWDGQKLIMSLLKL